MCPENMRPVVEVIANSSNIIKKLCESDIDKIEEYSKTHPGEFYKTEYWKKALDSGLSIEVTAESLRLYWMTRETLSSTEYILKVIKKTEPETLPKDQNEDFLVFNSDSGRKIFNKKQLEFKFFSEDYSEKLKNLLNICNKVSKRPLNEIEVVRLLVRFKGIGKDVVSFLISSNSQQSVDSIFKDCCRLSKSELSFNSFLSQYVKHNCSPSSIYTYFSKSNK